MNNIDPTPFLHTCTYCALHSTCKAPVHGEGHSPCDILVIGEGPGRNENEQGRPFIGLSGQLLRATMKDAGIIDGPMSVYITNSVKCWPNDEGKNRKPSQKEIDTCRHWLDVEIAVLEPKHIIALGDTALKAIKVKEKITNARTKDLSYNNIPVHAVFHPSYALRSPTNRLQFIQDIARVSRRLGLSSAIQDVDYAHDQNDLNGYLGAFSDPTLEIVALDTEFFDGRLECFSYSTRPGYARVVFAEDPQFIEKLQSVVFDSPGLLLHNAPADVPLICETLGITLENFPWYKITDTMVIAYCTGSKGKDVGLKTLAQANLGVEVTRLDEVWDGKSPLSTLDREWLIRYACQDADLTMRLYPILLKVLKDVDNIN